VICNAGSLGCRISENCRRECQQGAILEDKGSRPRKRQTTGYHGAKAVSRWNSSTTQCQTGSGKARLLIADGELECRCGQGAQAVALSGFLFGTRSEGVSLTHQVTNFAVRPVTMMNAATRQLAPGPDRVAEA
jgi:hypothetical protein